MVQFRKTLLFRHINWPEFEHGWVHVGYSEVTLVNIFLDYFSDERTISGCGDHAALDAACVLCQQEDGRVILSATIYQRSLSMCHTMRTNFIASFWTTMWKQPHTCFSSKNRVSLAPASCKRKYENRILLLCVRYIWLLSQNYNKNIILRCRGIW